MHQPTRKAEELQKEHDNIDHEIELLKKKKINYAAEIERLKGEVEHNKADLIERESRFNSTFKSLAQKIESDIETYNSLL